MVCLHYHLKLKFHQRDSQSENQEEQKIQIMNSSTSFHYGNIDVLTIQAFQQYYQKQEKI